MASTTVNIRLSDEQINKIRAHIEAAAGEFKGALNAVRDLHKPTHLAGEIPGWGPHCHTCRDSTSRAANWPCATARLVYTQDEITTLQQ
jgi:hypothetical protein